ncbi:4a-hydroxytetrahydrobiopterin dehydratase [Streptomyces sp. NPDC001156]
MERIFVSYRREDGAAEAWLLQEKLSDHLGGAAVFLDTSSVSPGTIWPDRLRQALDNASAVLVVIGPNWITASDEWSRRRIDLQDDWVRLEVEKSLDSDKAVLPILVRGAIMPPAESLPKSISALALRQAIELRSANDVDLIVKHLIRLLGVSKSDRSTRLFPRPAPELPDLLSEEKIEVALRGTLRQWRIQQRKLDETSPGTKGATPEAVGLYREYRFRTFRDAVSFMHVTAPGCDIAIHHPVWENIWRTVRIYLTTWDIGHRISDRDVQLAKYFERAYEDFPEADRVD